MNTPDPGTRHVGNAQATQPPSPARHTTWADVERAAPQLAGAVRSRFEANRHHVLGTVRADGSPRLSGTEVRFADDEAQLGMMTASRKLADVLADPRVELHSAPLDPDVREGDARLRGRLIYSSPATEADGSMFTLDIEQVLLTRVEGDELVVTSWSPSGGLHEIRRR